MYFVCPILLPFITMHTRQNGTSKFCFSVHLILYQPLFQRATPFRIYLSTAKLEHMHTSTCSKDSFRHAALHRGRLGTLPASPLHVSVRAKKYSSSVHKWQSHFFIFYYDFCTFSPSTHDFTTCDIFSWRPPRGQAS